MSIAVGDRPSEGGSVTRVLEKFTDVLERNKVEYGIFIGLFVALVAFTIYRPVFPNYDTYYALIWGDEIAHFNLPDYYVNRTPTPHPLFNLYTAFLSPLGGAAIHFLTIASLAMYVGLLYGAYKLVKLQVGTLVAFFTLLVLLTRTDLLAFGFRSMLDIPFLAMIVWAAVLEVQKPRRGVAPLVLLTLAGLLRPEAWLMAGIYWLWLALGHVRPKLKLPGELPSIKKLFFYALLVIAAPVIWLVWDWIVTGDALYSIHSTSEVAAELKRNKSLFGAIAAIPKNISGTEQWVTAVCGTLGFGLAFYVYRQRMLMLAALGVVGVITYLLIAVAGLSVIPRYLVIPSIILCFGVAFAVIGWERLEGNARKVGIALAVLTVLMGIVRAPSYLDHFRALNTSTQQVSVTYSRIYNILDKPKVRKTIENCEPITAFTHETVPIIRYKLGLPKGDVPTTTALPHAPTEGTVLMQTSALDPLQMTIVDRVLRKQWTGFHQPGFKFRGENRAWVIYTSCPAKR
jgi:hypothetical protein